MDFPEILQQWFWNSLGYIQVKHSSLFLLNRNPTPFSCVLSSPDQISSFAFISPLPVHLISDIPKMSHLYGLFRVSEVQACLCSIRSVRSMFRWLFLVLLVLVCSMLMLVVVFQPWFLNWAREPCWSGRRSSRYGILLAFSAINFNHVL